MEPDEVQKLKNLEDFEAKQKEAKKPKKAEKPADKEK